MGITGTRISDASITVVLDGRVRSLANNNLNFPKLREALKEEVKDLDLIRQLIDIPSFIALQTNGDVQVGHKEVRYRGEVLHSTLVDRILKHLGEGISITPLTNFLNLLMQNPLVGVREDLFAWLEAGDMPITDDGYLIAYKKVQNDYYSYHTGKRGKVLHALNTVVTMPREEVDNDRRNECSYGLHFCSYGYLSGYNGGSGKVLIVKINPSDVVAIPNDYHRQKGRTWRMEVVDEIVEAEAEAALVGRLVISKQGTYEAGVQSTAKISDFNDNQLGFDTKNNSITEARLRGLLAHGGVDYAAGELGVDVNQVTAWVEKIDFPIENLGVLPSPAVDGDSDIILASATPEVVPANEAPTLLTFKASDGTEFTADEIISGVEQHGQRGFSKTHGVPRTTLQGWLAAAREATTE